MYLTLTVGNLVEVGSGRRWTANEFQREVRLRIARLASLGLCPGDRVFILFGNRIEFFAELIAAWRLGACVIPIDSRLTPYEVETLAGTARPAIAIADFETSVAVTSALRPLGVQIVSTRETGAEERDEHRMRLDDDALILFTSGSTGNPKGVVHTHRSLRARWVTLYQSLGISDFARTLCVLPTHFGHGLICNCLFPWLAGCDLYITPPFQPDILMKLGSIIDEHGITFLSSVPSVWKLALRVARPPQSGSLRRVHVGSAPLSADTWTDIRKWTGVRHVCNAYGITETGSWTAGLADASCESEDGLIGTGWGCVIKVLMAGDTNTDLLPEAQCSPGEIGYVWLNTPALMKGYYERHDLTRAAVLNGWFLTGDMGFIDGRGRLVLRGRERDEINKGGMKIYPADVDAVIERFAHCTDVCTFAIEDVNYGQSVGVAFVLDTHDEAAIRSLFHHVKSQLSDAKLPSQWWLVESIPRTSRGKINRDFVRDACMKSAPLDLVAILRRGT